MKRLVERVRLLWMSLHPRTRALTVLARSAAVDRAQNTNWQLNQHANDLLPEVSEAIWRRLHYLDSGGGRA